MSVIAFSRFQETGFDKQIFLKNDVHILTDIRKFGGSDVRKFGAIS